MYSSHNKERRVRSKETVREERRGSRDRVFKEEEGRRNSRDQLIDGGERRGSRDLRNSRDHLHASKEQLKESLKATVLLDPYQKSGSRHGSSEKLLGSMQPKIMDEFDTGNENTDTESSLSKPDREVSHQEQTYSGVYSEDDSGQHGNNIRSSENQKLANQPLNSTDLKLYKKNPPKVSGTLPRISGTPSNSLDVKEDGNLAFLARRHKQRRSSLLPTETERTYPIANQRRRNSSTVLIISPPSNPDCSPIFINKEDGLARY
ncbi:uncharacterized protein LOC111711106 [Eurytemora carolleeae]|uniref:uncharacterized protein LOC111711106 n=1 Tax=Eurytemora carolleeae TaxID=1294199 RepID=UPI000C776922|nr:uncharacterized protein LOC111711106 [Eurytemora carolleeae]|eukprot:XP_023341124.1 uncharacterized protein LOC111711106 [Eurytemora affinis]